MNKAILAICIASLVSLGAMAQKVQKSPASTLKQTVGTTDITIVYHRPGLKGRSLESLAPTGKVWRTGANEATELTISKGVKIGGNDLSAGTYSLYTIPGDEWTFIINSKLSWGTQYDDSSDVLRFKVKAMNVDENTETFTIGISDISKDGASANLELRWANVVVKAPIEVTL
ncbi:MAG: DUF2911 domain-containing protein [Cyclobacteriaceae bacterium]|nr:DUF2911 domain-containing protein [Cyclobacteriaceae bacterium]